MKIEKYNTSVEKDGQNPSSHEVRFVYILEILSDLAEMFDFLQRKPIAAFKNGIMQKN
jgi:hypothetical protein